MQTIFDNNPKNKYLIITRILPNIKWVSKYCVCKDVSKPTASKIKNLKSIIKANKLNILNLNKLFFFGKNNIKNINTAEKYIASFLIHIEIKNNTNIITL